MVKRSKSHRGPKIKPQAHIKKRLYSAIQNATIRKNFDKKLTARQNLEKLGLIYNSNDLNERAKGKNCHETEILNKSEDINEKELIFNTFNSTKFTPAGNSTLEHNKNLNKKRKLSHFNVLYIEKILKKYNTDFTNIEFDLKLNPNQLTKKQVEKLYKDYQEMKLEEEADKFKSSSNNNNGIEFISMKELEEIKKLQNN